MTGSINVPWTGTRAVTAPATWSQLGIWRTMRKTSPGEGRMNIRFTVPLPAGRTVDHIGQVVAELVSAHEALRTVHPLSPDGQVTQVVTRHGELPLELIEGGADVNDKLADVPFDHATELPGRFVILLDDGEPRDLLVVLSPLSVDWVAEQLTRLELTSRLNGRWIDRAPTELSPVDVALEENSAAGEAVNRLSVAQWADLVNRYEPTNFPVRLRTNTSPRWTGATLRSPRLASAVAQLREELGVSESAVHQAASAVMIAALSGNATAVMHNMTSNRSTRAESACVGRLAQASASAIEVASHSFREVVVRAASAGVRSYAMGHYSTADVDAVVDADLFDGFHNNRFHRFPDSLATASGSAPVMDPTITSIEPLDFNTHQYKVEVNHDNRCAHVTLVADHWYLPSPAPDLLLTTMESLVVEATIGATGPSAVSFVERLL